jgi:hypothetical protein
MQDFLFYTASRSAPIQRVPAILSPGVKQHRPEADQSPESNAKIKNIEAMIQLPIMSSWHRA